MGLCPFRVGPVAAHWSAPLFEKRGEWYWNPYTPYVYGGWRKEDGGLDCSQFVQARYRDGLGIDIDPAHATANTNAERLRLACEPVEQPEPGDLIFFHGTYDTPGASHVGIVRDPARAIMLDDHQRSAGNPGETEYGTPYWLEHFLSFGRVRR